MKTDPDYLKQCRSIAVMGGTFDPIHLGHLSAAEAVRRKYEPQRVLFIPSGKPPHKNGAAISDGEHRYKMALLATAEHPHFDVSRVELDKPELSYTVETLRTLRELLPEGADIFLIIGADAAEEILTWKKPDEIAAQCKLVAVTRPGVDAASIENHIAKLKRRFRKNFEILNVPRMEISATEIRRRVSSGEPARFMLPEKVFEYIKQNGLYGFGFDFEKAKMELESRLSEKRFKHTLGVVEESEKLAVRYGADVKKARVAALLHDCAKEYSNDKKRALCALWGIELDEILEAHIVLTHSLLGAESARRDYGIEDEEILRAIRFHTAGSEEMGLLDKIIMLADYIEPYRSDYPGLAKMREVAYRDINEALRLGISDVIKFLEQNGRAVHPRGRAALKKLEEGNI